MHHDLFARFAPVIRTLSPSELAGAASIYDKLRIAQAANIEVCYAPLEHVNRDARVVIVGITPGRTQMLNAVRETRRLLDSGASMTAVLQATKRAAAFSGTMRPNLIALLDCVGLHRWLGIPSCSELFSSASHLAQTASLLRSPVFVSGENYNGKPDMTRHGMLQEQLMTQFGEDAKRWGDAVFVPLGDTVAEGLSLLADRGLISPEAILTGIPHPSGANAERISYFIGKKSRSALSAKTDPTKLDSARQKLTEKLQALA